MDTTACALFMKYIVSKSKYKRNTNEIKYPNHCVYVMILTYIRDTGSTYSCLLAE